MTDGLVTKQRLEAKQLLFYSQLFQQLLADLDYLSPLLLTFLSG